MNYLFFDIECCDGKHICEFGYVLTDESFNVISRNVITINPNMPFDLTARPNHKELELYYSDAKYYLSPTFPELYEEIKGIVTAPDQMIFGHAIENDAKFLSTACIRYDLPPIDFKFYDSQKLFDHVEETGSTTSLELAIEKYSLPKPEYFHRSDCDAYATMELIRILMGKLEISPTELEEKHFYCAGRIENHVIRLNEERYKWEKALADLAEGTISKNKAKALIPRLISRMERLEETENPEINEKTVCFDNSFEKNHTRETVAIMQLVINAGGKYITQADVCDIFVNTSSADPKENPRLALALPHVKADSNAKLLTLTEFLTLLGVTREQLYDVPLPTIEVVMKHVEPKQKPQELPNSAGESAPSTLGAILKAKGFKFNS